MIKYLKKVVDKINGYQDLDKLKKRGLKIGENCSIQHGVLIDESHCWHIQIGNNVTLAPNVHILAHDASLKLHTGYVLIGKVIIEDNVFIGASSIILPNVTIGKNSIIGASSTITKNVPSNVVYAGNPARKICDLSDFISKHELLMETEPKFSEMYTINESVSDSDKSKMNQLMVNGIGYLK